MQNFVEMSFLVFEANLRLSVMCCFKVVSPETNFSGEFLQTSGTHNK